MKFNRFAAFLTVVALSAAAQASFNFNFNGTAFSNSAGLSTYMSGIYGSSIAVSDAIGTNNTFAPTPGETWDFNNTDYARVGPAGVGRDMEFHFQQVAIRSVSLRGFVFDEARGPRDFRMTAYDSTFGNVETPNAGAQVFSITFNVAANGTEVLIPLVNFSRPVSLLVFSDMGAFDVGIDDLVVQAVPVPAAAVLGVLGLGLIGRWTRRSN